MLRFALLVLATVLTVAVDGMVENHCLKANEASADTVIRSYEKPEQLHVFHRFEQWALGVAFVSGLFCLTPLAKRLRWVTQAIWPSALVLALLVGILSLLFEMAAQGAESQFGVELSFWDSAYPMLLLDLVVIVLSGALLVIGPPRGWSGEDELGIL